MFDKIDSFLNDYGEFLSFIIICCLIFIIACSFVSTYDKQTSDEIKSISSTENISVYDKCWKLEKKYYCKEEK